MNKRYRRFSGTIATIVFALSLAGSVWASVCVVPTAVAAETTTAEHPVEQACTPSDGLRDGRDRGSECPSGPAAQGCVTAASLPAASIADFMSAPEDVSALVGYETEPTSVPATALFHPPRA